MLTVVAALIQSEGKLLVCQRRRGSKFELLWEFPGGKVEPGETLEYALDDFSIARLAVELHDMKTYAAFMRRSSNWMTLFDASARSIVPRDGDGRHAGDRIETRRVLHATQRGAR